MPTTPVPRVAAPPPAVKEKPSRKVRERKQQAANYADDFFLSLFKQWEEER